MCGECDGVSFWCNSCEQDVKLKVRNEWNEAYVRCKCCESESGRICNDCANRGHQYCSWCLKNEDGLLDSEIRRLTIANELLRFEMELILARIKMLIER